MRTRRTSRRRRQGRGQEGLGRVFRRPDLHHLLEDDARGSGNGDLGFTAGTYEDSVKGPDGKTVNEKGKYLCVWKKQKDGTWKAIHDMWNADSK